MTELVEPPLKEAWLIRNTFSDERTFGGLVLGDQVLHTLEPPWLENLVNKSCIPAGRYRVNYLKKSYSGKYKDVYHIVDVDGRSGILIHKGNLVGHSTGCVIIGLIKGFLGSEPAVLSSAVALERLHGWANRESFMLNVVSSKNFILNGTFEV